MATEHQKVLELVIYKLKDGTTEGQFTQAYDGLSEWIKRQPGFVSRDLLRGTADGQWLEIVWWTNQEDADAVAAASMDAPECAPFFEAIDMNAAQLLYGTPAAPRVVA